MTPISHVFQSKSILVLIQFLPVNRVNLDDSKAEKGPRLHSRAESLSPRREKVLVVCRHIRLPLLKTEHVAE